MKLVENEGITLFLGGIGALLLCLETFRHTGDVFTLCIGVFIFAIWTGGTFFSTYGPWKMK